jgi:Serine/threonine protein phosphatase
MICPKCGAKVTDGDNFCEECGASLKKIRHTDVYHEDWKDVCKSDIVAADLNLAVSCNIGRKHPANEDAGTVIRCENGNAIIIVADGVSSAVNAVSASKTAVAKVTEVLSGRKKMDADLLKTAIAEANNKILELPHETREDGIYGPETTIVVAAVEDGSVTISWVGDSRAYIVDESGQKLLTTDDSWVEMVVASGEMTREEAMKDRLAHCVTQVLGMHDQAMEIHNLEAKIEKGRMLILCSDGLWNYLQGENELQKAVMDFGMEKDASEICEYLVNQANTAGGHDNITAAVLKYN